MYKHWQQGKGEGSQIVSTNCMDNTDTCQLLSDNMKLSQTIWNYHRCFTPCLVKMHMFQMYTAIAKYIVLNRRQVADEWTHHSICYDHLSYASKSPKKFCMLAQQFTSMLSTQSQCLYMNWHNYRCLCTFSIVLPFFTIK